MGTQLAGPETPGPILQIVPGNASQTEKLKAALLAAGIYPPLINYPNGSDSAYFRFVISSEHTPAQLNTLVGVLQAHT